MELSQKDIEIKIKQYLNIEVNLDNHAEILNNWSYLIFNGSDNKSMYIYNNLKLIQVLRNKC